MTWWETAAVSLVGAIVGGGLTSLTAFAIFKRQEQAAIAREVKVALSNYFGALVIAVAQLQRMPEEPPSMDVLSELARHAPEPVRKWIEAQRWISTEKDLRRTLGPEPFAAAERVVLAHAPLHLMPLPTTLRKALDKSLDYIVELSLNRSEETKERWTEIQKQLTEAIRAHVVHPDVLLRALQPKAG